MQEIGRRLVKVRLILNQDIYLYKLHCMIQISCKTVYCYILYEVTHQELKLQMFALMFKQVMARQQIFFMKEGRKEGRQAKEYQTKEIELTPPKHYGIWFLLQIK